MKKWRAQPVYFDGQTMKSINPWDVDSDVGWSVIGGDDTKRNEGDYFRLVPWLYRAVIDRSNNVGKMPFAIMQGETEYDTSTDYANKLEFMPDPTTLFKKVEMSLAMCGRAYLKKELNGSGYIKNLKYIVPTSIAEHYNEAGEIDYYERSIKGRKFQIPANEIVTIYLPDYMTENGPGKSSPAMAALVSAGVIYNVDEFVSAYFKRGAIKATILTTLGFQQAEAEKLQKWWDDVVTGIKNAFSGAVIKGEQVKPVVIGEGLESLTNETLVTERRQNIATAMGVPESRMWSAAANYATRVQDDKAYYEGTIIPDCDLIVEAFSKQVFIPEHHIEQYSLVFQTETLDVFQVDAAAQAGAFAQLTDGKLPLLIALDVLGFNITEEQRAELKKVEEEAKAKADQMAQAQTDALNKPAEKQPANGAPIKGGEGSGNFGHEGRPGEVGGSGSGGGAATMERGSNEVVGKAENRWGDKGPDIYKINDASELAELYRYRTVVVSRTTDEIYASGAMNHADIIRVADPDNNEDKYVRFSMAQRGSLVTDTNNAGVVISSDDDEERAINNIYNALDKLTARGLPHSTPVKIMGRQKVINTTAKMLPIEYQNKLPALGNDLGLWQKKALKRLKEGGSPVCDFTSNEIPQEDNDRIKAALAECKTADDVKAVFARHEHPEPVELASQLKRAMDWLEVNA